MESARRFYAESARETEARWHREKRPRVAPASPRTTTVVRPRRLVKIFPARSNLFCSCPVARAVTWHERHHRASGEHDPGGAQQAASVRRVLTPHHPL